MVFGPMSEDQLSPLISLPIHNVIKSEEGSRGADFVRLALSHPYTNCHVLMYFKSA